MFTTENDLWWKMVSQSMRMPDFMQMGEQKIWRRRTNVVPQRMMYRVLRFIIPDLILGISNNPCYPQDFHETDYAQNLSRGGALFWVKLAAKTENYDFMLTEAVWHNNTRTVEYLLNQGADPDAKNGFGDTALHLAIKQGNDEIIGLLLEYGASINIHGREGKTVLEIASEKGGAMLERRIFMGYLGILGVPELQQDLFVAVYNGDYEAVNSLLDRGVEPEVSNIAGLTPLHFAVSGNNLAIIDLLISRNADMNAINLWGGSLLHCATLGGTPAIFQTLLDRGCDPNSRDNEGKTPLHYAALSGNLPVAGLLLDRGCDPNSRDNEGKTPLHSTVLDSLGTVSTNHPRGKSGPYLIKATFLLERGADPNIKDGHGNTCMHYAARAVGPELLRLLEKHGGKCSIRSMFGRDAWDIQNRTQRKIKRNYPWLDAPPSQPAIDPYEIERERIRIENMTDKEREEYEKMSESNDPSYY